MKDNDLLKFFTLQRQIFGVCPHTNQLFRLSDCTVYLKKRPEHDWLEKIRREQEKIEKAGEKLDEKEDSIREKAKEKGRKDATRQVKKIDRIFAPLKLNADDSKVIFHPIDFIVFNGMKKAKQMKEIVLLDSKRIGPDKKRLQQSIEKAVEKDNYEWITLRVEDNGKIKEE